MRMLALYLRLCDLCLLRYVNMWHLLLLLLYNEFYQMLLYVSLKASSTWFLLNTTR